jgi:four helix bundle protein
MQNPKNLQVTSRAMSLAKETYLLTNAFPRNEQFGLTSQMRRAAVSIGSNIAEGCGRGSDREFRAFLHIALGSASELEFQLELARELRFTTLETSAAAASLVQEVKRMLSRLIVAVRLRERKTARPRKSKDDV